MLEVYRVKEPAIPLFAEWIPKQKGISEISRMQADDGTVVFLLKNTSREPLDPDRIPRFGIDIRRLNQVNYNFEFKDMSELLNILHGKSRRTIGVDYILDLIKSSLRDARPLTVRLATTNETFVIVSRNGKLIPVPIL